MRASHRREPHSAAAQSAAPRPKAARRAAADRGAARTGTACHKITRRLTFFAALAALVTLVLAAAATMAGAATAPPAPGLRIAFVRGDATTSVWTSAGTGAGARRLGSGMQPIVSPSGSDVAVVVASQAGSEVDVVAGADRHVFFKAADIEATPIAWSADSRYVAVQISADSPTGRGDELGVIDTSNWTSRVLVHGIVNSASFDPVDSSRLVYGVEQSMSLTAADNLEQIAVTGGSPTALTHDGRSLNPLWTARGIVYDRERVRLKLGFPEFQLWLLHEGRARQLTHVAVGPLVSGLVPVAADADGNRLIASFTGEDTDYAVTIQLSPLRVHTVTVGKAYPVAAGISRSGRTVLLDVGSFEAPPSAGTVDTQPFFGGPAHVLTRGADASWNG